MFYKLKTSISAPAKTDNGESETRRRHRLSKPLTNKSSTNLLILSAQQESRSKNSSVSEISSGQLSSQPASEDSQDHVRSGPVASESDAAQAKSIGPQQKTWHGTAPIVTDIEDRDAVAALPLSPTSPVSKPKRPLSAFFTSYRFPNSQNKTLSQRKMSSGDVNELAPYEEVDRLPNGLNRSSTEDKLAQNESAPKRRRSSFTPGVATRSSKDGRKATSSREKPSNIDRDYFYNPNLSEESPLGQIEDLNYDEEWSPPPPVVRTETPSDLDYTHLGGLRLGSLHVVNGRASPAPSALSIHFGSRSAPAFKRDTSSDYGDVENGGLTTMTTFRWISGQGQYQDFSDVATGLQRISQAPRAISSLRVQRKGEGGFSDGQGFIQTKRGSVLEHTNETEIDEELIDSPDRTSRMAMEYIAELSGSPFSVERPFSPTGSVLKCTSKRTEFDDELFENESAETPSTEEADHMTLDTWYSPSDASSTHGEHFKSCIEIPSKMSHQSTLLPPSSTETFDKPDSGYSSNVSRQSSQQENRGAPMKNVISTEPHYSAKDAGKEVMIPKIREERRPGPRPFGASILKSEGGTDLILPTFANLNPSSNTVPTTKSSSFVSTSPPKPRKLQKRRPLSHPVPPRQIALQSDSKDHIPPIPPSIAENLAIRSRQVPELERTFTSMYHTRESQISLMSAHEPAEVKFPSPLPSPHDSDEEDPVPRNSNRNSYVKWPRNDGRTNQYRVPSGISEHDAMAIIQDFGTVTSSLGASPYELATRTLRPANAQGAQNETWTIARKPIGTPDRPRLMMDAPTAAEVARRRSKTVQERDNGTWKEKRNSFNDRGGIPGRKISPRNIPGTIPPLPPMPSHEQVRHRETWRSSYQQPFPQSLAAENHYWQENFPPASYESRRPPPASHCPQHRSTNPFDEQVAPPPPSHFPRPRSIHLFEDAPPPPPPSHSPRPMVVDSQFAGEDIWAAQAQAWKSRRASIGEMLRSRPAFNDEEISGQNQYVEELAHDDQLYPDIPPRHLPRSFVSPTENEPVIYRQSSSNYYEDYQQSGLQLSQPSYGPYVSDIGDRPHSRQSRTHSRAGSYVSLAESLHPPERPPVHPSPQFGRYSGGMNYGYEHGAGFGGSAGTRSVSGVAKATRKGVPLSEGFGIDLSDVPIIAGIRRL